MAAVRQPAWIEAGPSIRPYRSADRDGVLSLLAEGRSAAYAAHKRQVFDWQCLANPARGAAAPFIVAQDPAQQLVATLGLMPVRVRTGGREQSAFWVQDVFVSATHRGQGWGRQIVQQASGHAQGQCMLVYGISDMSDPIFAQQGWVLDGRLQTHFLHLAEPGAKGLCKNLLSRARALWLGWGAARARAHIDVRSQAPEAAHLQVLWASVKHQYPNAVVRDAAHLLWRYRDAPLLRYQWVQARQDLVLKALLVVRHGETESVIADYVGPLDRPGLLHGLLRAAVAALRAQGTRRIRCECTHPALHEALRSLGFRVHRQAPRFRIKAGKAPGAAPTGPWFLMTGDSDNDVLDLRQPLPEPRP